MEKILIFAGTTEGRDITEYLQGLVLDKEIDAQIYMSVATEYGKVSSKGIKNIHILSNRLNEDEMKTLISGKMTGVYKSEADELPFDIVIDATHPFAREVSVNIKNACKISYVKYIRLLRDEDRSDFSNFGVHVDSIDSAVEYLKGTKGNILVTTGSKELYKYTEIDGYKDRVVARVLSSREALGICFDLGFEGKNLIAMQGPFTYDMNYNLINQFNIKYLVTKDSGKNGGFSEKILACQKSNILPIIIDRPKEEGYSLNEVKEILNSIFCIKKNLLSKHIYLVGIGMGSRDTLTIEAFNTIKNSDVIIGAERMVKAFSDLNKHNFICYKPKEIKKYIDKCSYEKIAVLFSGDTGFFSGATKLLDELRDYKDVFVYPGISSASYISSKIRKSFENAKIVSLHGRNENILSYVYYHEKTIAILDSYNNLNRLCQKFVDYNLNDIDVYAAFNMSYDNEKYIKGKPKDLLNYKSDSSLCSVFIENKNYHHKRCYRNIKDYEFIRGKVPMTKENVRILSIIKLGIKDNSIIYDIGAGTGSISIEMALNSPKGKVYAIEKNEEAINLIKQNIVKFCAFNVQVVEGLAPKVLDNLEVPTHVFIGGTSGNLKQIFNLIISKNPKVSMVINAITLETLTEIISLINEYRITDYTIENISSSYSRKVGRYNMMEGENPIYIVSINAK